MYEDNRKGFMVWNAQNVWKGRRVECFIWFRVGNKYKSYLYKVVSDQMSGSVDLDKGRSVLGTFDFDLRLKRRSYETWRDRKEESFTLVVSRSSKTLRTVIREVGKIKRVKVKRISGMWHRMWGNYI